MKFKLTLTTEDGTVIDQFEIAGAGTPEAMVTLDVDEWDGELVGRPIGNTSLCERLQNDMFRRRNAARAQGELL